MPLTNAQKKKEYLLRQTELKRLRRDYFATLEEHEEIKKLLKELRKENK